MLRSLKSKIIAGSVTLILLVVAALVIFVGVGIHRDNIPNYLFFYAAVVLCLGVVAAIIFAATITKPIAVLAADVKRANHGKPIEGIDTNACDEIAQLAQSFNSMTENLRQATVSREFMDKIINTMSDALLVISPNGVIKYVNPAFGKLFGYDTARLPGRGVDEFDGQEAPRRLYGAFEQLFEKGRLLNYESACLNSSGEPMQALFSLAVMHDEQGAAEAVVCAARDISAIKTAQKNLEQKQAELEELNRSLNDTVAERAKELATANQRLLTETAACRQSVEELRNARDAAEKVNRVKNDFLINMSQDMRTPLNSIISGTEYLTNTSLSGDQGRRLDTIRQAANNLLALADDILDLLAGDAGQVKLSQRKFCLADTLEHIIRMLNEEANRKQLKLALRIYGNLPAALMGDEIRLQQVLMNLITNAINFTVEGSVTVSAVSGSQKDDAVPITFEVRDTGIGIEEDKLERIFENLVQTDPSIARKHGGSGLGLAVSRRLVKAMGGHLRVESTVGVGSMFSFTIPLSVPPSEEIAGEADKPVQAKAAAVPVSFAPDNAGNFPLVLLVDDSVDNRKLLSLLMVRRHFNVHEASNGREALELFEQNSYALVLMDIQMPVMDGYTATRMLRQFEKESGREKTPIIALTAHATEEDVRASVEAGFDDHISKPFKKESLFACISRYIE